VTEEERQLLETTARTLLKLKEDIGDRVAGIEAVLLALFLAHGRTDIALARLRVQADFLKMKGTPSAYLSSFVMGAGKLTENRDRLLPVLHLTTNDETIA
jgi:hypothetical protein